MPTQRPGYVHAFLRAHILYNNILYIQYNLGLWIRNANVSHELSPVLNYFRNWECDSAIPQKHRDKVDD